MIFKNQYHKLRQGSSKSRILTLFLLAHSVLLIMMLYTFPRINSSMGTQAFDLKTFGYTPDEALIMIQNLDQSTINFYIFPQLFLLDILYPLLLALFLSQLMIRLVSLTQLRLNNIISNIWLLPFIAMFIDYFENIMIYLMITNPTDISMGIIKMASIFTQMKGVFTTLSWIVILILFVFWIKNRKKLLKSLRNSSILVLL